MAEEFERLDKDKKGELDAQELRRSNLLVKHARPEDVAGAWGVRRIVAVTEGRISECTAEIVWQSSTRSMGWGVSLIVSGMLGGSLLLERVPVKLVIAWLIVLAGMVHLMSKGRSGTSELSMLCKVTQRRDNGRSRRLDFSFEQPLRQT